MTTTELSTIIQGKGFKTSIQNSRFGYSYVFVCRATASDVCNALVGTQADGLVEVKQFKKLVAVYIPGSKQ